MRTISTPGVGSGTRTIECRRYFGAAQSVNPMKISRRQCGCPTPELHHLRPFNTTCSPSRTAVACMLVASEDAMPGSVMQNADRISPARSGFNQSRFCSSDPYLTRTSMFPVSGGLQLKTSGAMEHRPIISAKGAYSTFVSPAPYGFSGRKRFHRPADLALALSSSMIDGCFQVRQSATFWTSLQYLASPGNTCSCMNVPSLCSESWARVEGAKCIVEVMLCPNKLHSLATPAKFIK